MPRSRNRRITKTNVQIADRFREVNTKFGPVQERVEGAARIYHAWKMPGTIGSKLEIEREAHKDFKKVRAAGGLPVIDAQEKQADGTTEVVTRPMNKQEYTLHFIEREGKKFTMIITDLKVDNELEGTVKMGDGEDDFATVHGKNMGSLITRMKNLLRNRYKIRFPLISVGDHEVAREAEKK